MQLARVCERSWLGKNASQDHKKDRAMLDREEKEEEERKKEKNILPHKVHTQGTKKKNLNNVFQKVDKNPES